MKPSAFRYVVPRDLDAAIAARAAHEDSVILSGGQSLIPTMNFRLSHPEVVIDLRRVPELDYVRTDPGSVRVGAMTRQRTLELDAPAYRANPLIRATVQNVAHSVIRNRGTVGGSLAHADPAAELPCLLTTLRGEVIAQGPGGRRRIAAGDFFQFIFTTALESDELLVEAAFPVLDPGEGWAFLEFARRHGDFALAAVACTIKLDPGGRIERVRLGACGIANTPVVLAECEDILTGDQPSGELFTRAAALASGAMGESDDPPDQRAYREHLLRGLVDRALNQAMHTTGARV
jgi:carbon-monoxide dehydrogenase medium subunit